MALFETLEQFEEHKIQVLELKLSNAFLRMLVDIRCCNLIYVTVKIVHMVFGFTVQNSTNHIVFCVINLKSQKFEELFEVQNFQPQKEEELFIMRNI